MRNSLLSFVIEVTNEGNTPLTKVPVYDIYPSNAMEFVSSDLRTPEQTKIADKGYLYWDDITLDLGDIAPGQTVSFNVEFRILDEGTISNVATLGTVIDGAGNEHVIPGDSEAVVVSSSTQMIYLPLIQGKPLGSDQPASTPVPTPVPTVTPTPPVVNLPVSLCGLPDGCAVDARHPKGIAYHSGQKALYMVSRDTNQLLKLDGADAHTVQTAPTGAEPWDVVINEATNRIYVSNFSSGDVWVYDATTLDVIAQIGVGSQAAIMALLPDLDTVAVVVRSAGGVAFIQGTSFRQLVSTGPGVYGLAVDTVNNQVIATHRDAGNSSRTHSPERRMARRRGQLEYRQSGRAV